MVIISLNLQWFSKEVWNNMSQRATLRSATKLESSKQY